jgi:hypothetical protein
MRTGEIARSSVRSSRQDARSCSRGDAHHVAAPGGRPCFTRESVFGRSSSGRGLSPPHPRASRGPTASPGISRQSKRRATRLSQRAWRPEPELGFPGDSCGQSHGGPEVTTGVGVSGTIV